MFRLLDALRMGGDVLGLYLVLVPLLFELLLVVVVPLDRQMTQTTRAPTAPAANISIFINCIILL